jgi:MFS transporter, CP family, cyanate transporter
VTPTTVDPPRRGPGRAWLLVALVLIWLNLRPPMSAVSALLPALRTDLGLSGAGVSALTTLPTVGLAVFAFLGPRLTGRWGEERLIAGSALLILVGDLVRLMTSVTALFAGTVLVGAGIGLVTGAVPGLVKRLFPAKFAGLMALYTVTLTIGAAGGSGLVNPIGNALHASWAVPLAVVTVPLAVLAGVWWSPELGRAAASRARTAIPAAPWRDAVAWQVMGFFACTGFVFYFVLGWLPTVCHDRGMGTTASGAVLSVVTVVQIVGSLAVPVVIRRTRDQRGLVGTVVGLNVVGLAGVIVGPVPAFVWAAAIVLGLGLGLGFGLAMTLIGLRASDARTATGLSGMTQGLGYAVSAAGPFGAGLLHSATGGWTAPLVLLLAVCAIQLAVGLGAGRTREVLRDRDGAGRPA